MGCEVFSLFPPYSPSSIYQKDSNLIDKTAGSRVQIPAHSLAISMTLDKFSESFSAASSLQLVWLCFPTRQFPGAESELTQMKHAEPRMAHHKCAVRVIRESCPYSDHHYGQPSLCGGSFAHRVCSTSFPSRIVTCVSYYCSLKFNQDTRGGASPCPAHSRHLINHSCLPGVWYLAECRAHSRSSVMEPRAQPGHPLFLLCPLLGTLPLIKAVL